MRAIRLIDIPATVLPQIRRGSKSDSNRDTGRLKTAANPPLSTTSRFLIGTKKGASPAAFQKRPAPNSNRHAERLETAISLSSSTTSLFLIDTKSGGWRAEAQWRRRFSLSTTHDLQLTTHSFLIDTKRRRVRKRKSKTK